jgi:hypothetical protein
MKKIKITGNYKFRKSVMNLSLFLRLVLGSSMTV